MSERTLSLEQASAARRRWRLVERGEVKALLEIPLFRSGARVSAGDSRLKIERQGGLRATYVLRHEASGELGRVGRQGRRMILEVGGRSAEWRHFERSFGFVADDGTPLLRTKIRSGLLRISGEIAIKADLPDRDGLIAALLAAYLLIRKSEDEQAAGAAAATAATGN
jgi:hypothetical protein